MTTEQKIIKNKLGLMGLAQFVFDDRSVQANPTQAPQSRHDPRDLRQRSVLPLEAGPSVPRDGEDQAGVFTAVQPKPEPDTHSS